MPLKKYTEFPDVIDKTGMILLLADPVTGALFKIDQSLLAAIVSTPNLQAVTDVGFSTTTEIWASTFNIFNGTDFLAGLSTITDGTNTGGTLSLKSMTTINGSTLTSQETLTASHLNQLPDADGTLAVSVNGNTADATGNITLSVGGSTPDLQAVTDVGSQTTHTISVIGSDDHTSITQLYANSFSGSLIMGNTNGFITNFMPNTAVSNSRTIELPDADGTVALQPALNIITPQGTSNATTALLKEGINLTVNSTVTGSNFFCKLPLLTAGQQVTVINHGSLNNDLVICTNSTSGIIQWASGGLTQYTLPANDYSITFACTDNTSGVDKWTMIAQVVNIDTDGTFFFNSDNSVPSQKAVKTYVDAHVSTPDLQAVTTAGNATTDIIVAGGMTVLNPTSNSALHLYKGSTNHINITTNNLSTSNAIELPNAGGTFALSVNGVAADTAGNVTLAPVLPYKTYTALVTQTGTADPVEVTVFQNTIGTLTWTYSGSVGKYSLGSSALFTANKTFVNISVGLIPAAGVSPYFHLCKLQTTSLISAYSYNAAGAATNGILNAMIEVRVYP